MKNKYFVLVLLLVAITSHAQEDKPYCHIASRELLGSGGRDFRINSDSSKQKFCGDYDNEKDCTTKYMHKNGFSMCSWSAKRVVIEGKKVKLPDICVKMQLLQINVSKDVYGQCKVTSPWIASVDRTDWTPPNPDGTCPEGLVAWWESRVPNGIAGVSDDYKQKWYQDNHETLKVDKACYSSKEEAVAAMKKGFEDASVFKDIKIVESKMFGGDSNNQESEEPKNEKVENSANDEGN